MKGPMDMDKNCRVPLLITEEPNRQMTAPTMNENTSIEGEILLDIERHSDGWSQCSFTSTNALQEVGDREVNEVSCSNGVSYGDDYHHHQVDRHNPFSFLGVSPSFGAPTCSIDPFRNHTPNVSGLYEWIKTVICVPVALVRLLVFGLVLSIGFLATKLALVGWKDKHNPMPKSRCKIMWIPRIAARCILFCFGFHWIRRIGKPASRELAPIVVSNHVSYTDPIFFFYELFPSIVASETHDKIPVVGTIIRAMQVIYVDRFSSASRKRAVTEIKRKASCSDFPRVMLFPEGTTTNGRALISFQLGAFVPGFPIQPVVIRYPYVHFDPSWGKISLLKLMFRMLTQFHNFLEVEYLPVIFPTQSKKENPTTFARKVGYAMAKRLNVVQSEHSYGDLALASRASHIGLASTSDYMVEMAKMDRLFQLSAGEAIGFLDKFAAMEPDHSGRVSIDNFLAVLGLPRTLFTEQIFGFFDVESQGSIMYSKFLHGSASILKQLKFPLACELAFKHCDISNKGVLSEEEVERAMKLVFPFLPKDNVYRIFKIFDVDNDGAISWDDFKTCLERNPLFISLFNVLVCKDGTLGCS